MDREPPAEGHCDELGLAEQVRAIDHNVRRSGIHNTSVSEGVRAARARRRVALVGHWQVDGHDGLGHEVVGGVEGGCDLEGTAGDGIGAAGEGEE